MACEAVGSMTPEAHRCHGHIVELYGSGLAGDVGTLHVLALWKAPEGPPRIIRVDENAPASETDRFVLHLARARADAIVTSGSILRAEPRLSHEIGDGDEMRRELAAWRREVLGRAASPLSLVLTRGADLDLDHPFFESAAPRIIYTGQDAAGALEAPARERGIRVVGSPGPGLREAIAWLRCKADARNISLEVGATASRPLYEEPLGVDEILLSLYEEPEWTEVQPGEAFFDLDELERRLPETGAPVVRRETSGTWSFRRLRRPSA